MQSSATGGPFIASTDGLRVALRVQPGARSTRVDGAATLDDGSVVLKVRVTAPPEGGKANAALVKLLAKAWKLPKGALQVVAGEKDRRKILRVEGNPAELAPRLTAWLRTLENGTV
jgi:uncharacterized protein (TIGR00251 family)